MWNCWSTNSQSPSLECRCSSCRSEMPMSEEKQGVRLHGPVELVSDEAICWKRHKPTPVHALLAADLEEFAPREEPMRVEAPTFVYDFSPDALPAQVKAAVTKAAPNYQPTHSRTMDETSWANVCVHCRSLQGAFFLHGEPDGPLFGGPERFRGTRVVVSQEGLDADGGATRSSRQGTKAAKYHTSRTAALRYTSRYVQRNYFEGWGVHLPCKPRSTPSSTSASPRPMRRAS